MKILQNFLDLLIFQTKFEIWKHLISSFLIFFTKDIYQHIVNETNSYSTQINPNKPMNFTTDDIKHYLGILCMYMSIVKLSNIRDHWAPKFGFTIITEIMTLNKFEQIRRFLHFNDNSKMLCSDHPQHDRLHKIRPIITELRKRLATVPMEECLSVDEQICATKARHFLKQYMPMKPHKWGFKLFVICGTSGFSYDFEIYSGQENRDENRLADEPDLGSSSNVVVRLVRNVPRNLNYKVYFDNYYTSIPLLVYLSTKGIFSLGTVRRNRIPDCKLPNDVEVKKWARGQSCEFVSEVDGISVTPVAWKDNRAVNLLSTFVGEMPKETVERFDKKSNKKVSVECPKIIKQYNKHMGGVDLLDGLIGRHKITMRSRKWYFRLFYHLIDLITVNAWLLYKRTKGDTMKLSKFCEEIAVVLCKIGMIKTAKRGRPSLVEAALEEKRHRGPAAYVPPKDVRTDQVNHWPSWETTRQRCKMPGCNKGFSFTKCTKCGVSLCYTKKSNCFVKFHS